MQCACAMLSSVARPAVKCFFHIISQNARFLRPVIEHKMCVLIFSTTSAILRRNKRDMIINVYRSSCTGYYCWILMKLEFSLQHLPF